MLRLPLFHRARSARLPSVGPLLALALWSLAIGAGFRGLVEYELRAGAPAVAPDRWPAQAGLTFDASRRNLVMFAHPQCPCSRASVAELAAIMTRCAAQLHVTVCFFDPDEKPEAWTRSDLWRAAEAIPGVTPVVDRDARIAARFGSATSGQVFLFDRDGQRLFAGGITGARGHEGDNRGRQLVIALAQGEVCTGTTPVFGCALQQTPAGGGARP